MWHWIGWLPKRECTTGHCCIPTSFPHSSCSVYQHTLCLRHHENKSLHSLTIKSEASISHLLHEGILAIVSWVFQFIVLLVMFTWEIILISTLIRKCLIVHLCFVINPKSERTQLTETSLVLEIGSKASHVLDTKTITVKWFQIFIPLHEQTASFFTIKWDNFSSPHKWILNWLIESTHTQRE